VLALSTSRLASAFSCGFACAPEGVLSIFLAASAATCAKLLFPTFMGSLLFRIDERGRDLQEPG
jgi:hypothetical protein